MTPFQPMRQLPETSNFGADDTLVLFGELFSRGYANGLVEAAERRGMNIIYSTVGRRDDGEGRLRALTSEELEAAPKNLINVPLEAGFDLTKASNGQTPCDQLQGLKLKEWQTAKMEWASIDESCELARKDFRQRVRSWVEALAPRVNPSKKLVISHTMAGGVPRAKIIMPAMNRVFKGFGERYASSEEFWKSDLGRFCDKNFMEVTAKTFEILIEETESLREQFKKNGGHISYTAYGYHGTEVLVEGEYRWQSYSPYLQGFAKMALEKVALEQWKKGIPATVFNAPEILTNSSGVFLGIEVPLYPLLLALKKEGGDHPKMQNLLDEMSTYFASDYQDSQMRDFANSYFTDDVIQQWSRYEDWPQHNGPEQMDKIKESSQFLFSLQKDIKNPVTTPLSEVVFEACGEIMIEEAFRPREPVWWIGHDMIAQQKLRLFY